MQTDVKKIKKTNLGNYEKEMVLRENLLNSNLFTLESSRDEYILSLDPLIRKHAKKFVASGNGKVSFEDYVQEAYLRVMEKFDKFNFRTSDVRLSTYMNYQIVDAMQTLKVKFELAYSCSTSNVKLLSSIKRYMNEHPDASFQTIADYFSISQSRLIGILESEKRSVSIHKSTTDDEKNTLLDTVESNSKNAEQLLFLKKSNVELNNYLKEVLTDEEMFVLERTFGLNDKAKEELQKIANKKNCSKENVRQIKVRALNKIKESTLRDDICSLLAKIVSLQ